MNQINASIDTVHSSIGFVVRHMVFAKVRGRFGSWQGTLQLAGDDLTQASVAVEIDAASIDTGVADRDHHLRSGDFLDAETYPQLRFRSTRIEKAGENAYQVHGELTIRDVTREVTLEAQYAGRAKDPWGNEKVAFTATASLDRGEFGLKWNQALETGGLLVGERVEIEIELQAVTQAATNAA